MKKILALLLGSLLASIAGAEIVYELAYAEHFEGTALNQELWSRIGPGTADWDKQMSIRPDLVAVNEGQLHLYGKRNEDRISDPRWILTGGVCTRGKLALRYGKVEIRCKLEGQRGAWPAIWMMPDKPLLGWPADGEIDILERLNFDEFVYQTVHSKWTRKHPKEPPYTACAAVDADEWNVYGFEWTPDTLTWTINGEPTHTYTKINDLPEQFPWTRPFYLMIDMQLGGEWVGEVDVSTLPTAMHIDWVKFYTASEDGTLISEIHLPNQE